MRTVLLTTTKVTRHLHFCSNARRRGSEPACAQDPGHLPRPTSPQRCLGLIFYLCEVCCPQRGWKDCGGTARYRGAPRHLFPTRVNLPWPSRCQEAEQRSNEIIRRRNNQPQILRGEGLTERRTSCRSMLRKVEMSNAARSKLIAASGNWGLSCSGLHAAGSLAQIRRSSLLTCDICLLPGSGTGPRSAVTADMPVSARLACRDDLLATWGGQ